MLRDVSMEEISDGKKYNRHDLARLGCNDCKGCSSCCEEMGDTIILDPLDVYRITSYLACDFQSIIGTYLDIRIVDGVCLPGIKMNDTTGACGFLKEGRCSIHKIRPGICRLFPLGRAYEDGSFYYFLQKDECKVKNRSKVRIDKWIGEEDMASYEEFTLRWHNFLVHLRNMVSEMDDHEEIRTLSMAVLSNFYVAKYDDTRDFYEQVYERIDSYPLLK